MRISKTAETKHEELFPNHKSTLKVTDPELIEVFDNFAFDEVLEFGNLDTKTRGDRYPSGSEFAKRTGN